MCDGSLLKTYGFLFNYTKPQASSNNLKRNFKQTLLINYNAENSVNVQNNCSFKYEREDLTN